VLKKHDELPVGIGFAPTRSNARKQGSHSLGRLTAIRNMPGGTFRHASIADPIYRLQKGRILPGDLPNQLKFFNFDRFGHLLCESEDPPLRGCGTPLTFNRLARVIPHSGSVTTLVFARHLLADSACNSQRMYLK
jgi:hypothetical protein